MNQGNWRYICLLFSALAFTGSSACADTTLASDNFTLSVGTNLTTITDTQSSGVGTYTVIQGTPTTALSATNITALGFGDGNVLRWPGGGQTYYRAFNGGATLKLNDLSVGESLRLSFDVRFGGDNFSGADDFSFGFVNFPYPTSVIYANIDLNSANGLDSEFRYRTASFNLASLGTTINSTFTEPASALGTGYAIKLEVTRLNNGFRLDYYRDGMRIGVTTGLTASAFVTATGGTNITGVAFRGLNPVTTYIDNLQVVRALPTPSISGVAAQSVCSSLSEVTLNGVVSALGPTYPANGETVTATINGVSHSGTISGGSGAFSVTYPTTGLTPGVYTVTYSYAGSVSMNAAPNNTATALTIVDAGGAAGPITGSSTVSPYQAGVVYSIAPVSGASSYNWTVPTGASIAAGAGTPSITVTFGASQGNVSVAPVTGSCNGNSSSLAVAFTPIDLSVTSVTDTPDPVNVGDPVVYTIVVSNAGPDAAVTYYVTNTLGAGVTVTNAATDISDSGTISGSKVSWTLTSLAVGAKKTLTLRARAPLSQSLVANTATVQSYQPESQPADNSLTVYTSATCPGAPAPFLETVSSRNATNGQLLTFEINSTNVDCSTPFLQMAGLPATFPVVTNDAGHKVTGTFSWTPSGVGTYSVRFYSWNVGSPTSSLIIQLYVDNIGQPQTGGIWNSQTNWHVTITNLVVPASGNATVVWASAEGVTYDVYSSSAPIDGGASWSKVISGQEAGGSMATASVSSAGSMRFYQVVPQGGARTDRGVWGIVRPTIPSGLHLMAPPVLSDRSFADSGTFGQALAAAVPTGTRVHIAINSTPDWVVLERTAGGVWRVDPGATEYTTPLNIGQAFLIEGASGSIPVFSGAVGNLGTHTATLGVGFNLLSVSEGKGMAAATSFNTSPAPASSYDDDSADQIVIWHANGSQRRLQRLPNGTWYDHASRGTTTVTLKPGEAYYYIRRNSSATVGF